MDQADRRLVDAYQAGVLELDELAERRRYLTDQRRALEQELDQVQRLRRQRAEAREVMTSLTAFCERITTRLQDASFAERQAILQLVIERIIVGEDTLEIRHVIPLRSPPPGSGNDPVPIGGLRSDGVNLAALNGRVPAKRAADRLGQGLGAVDDEQSHHRRVEAALDEIVEQRLNRGGILGGPLDQPQRVLLAHGVDADRRHQDQVLLDVQAVDLDRQQIQRRQIACQPVLQFRARQRDELTADFEVPSPLIEATSPSGRRTERRNRRVETLISIWFIAQLAQPILALARGKAGKLQFPLAIRRPNPRPVDVDPAAMKSHRAPGLSPAPTTPLLMALVALPAQIGGLFLQEILERFDPGQQTEVLKAALNLLEGRLHSITLLGHRTKRYHRSRFAHSLRHGRCSSTWIQHPEPTGSGEQHPPQICNIDRDISGLHSGYIRPVADLPLMGRVVSLSLQIRRFRCPHSGCPRRIFAERLSAAAPFRKRRTVRLAEVQRSLALGAGGEPPPALPATKAPEAMNCSPLPLGGRR